MYLIKMPSRDVRGYFFFEVGFVSEDYTSLSVCKRGKGGAQILNFKKHSK
jgi:hypothetical protein